MSLKNMNNKNSIKIYTYLGTDGRSHSQRKNTNYLKIIIKVIKINLKLSLFRKFWVNHHVTFENFFMKMF